MQSRSELIPTGAGELAEVGTIVHNGTEYAAMGASITDGRAVVYVGACLNPYPGPMPGEVAMWRAGYLVGRPGAYGTRYAATTWDGTRIGELVEVASWRVPNGYTSGRLHAYQLTLSDGRRYAVRGSGPGMAASGRRMVRDGRPSGNPLPDARTRP